MEGVEGEPVNLTEAVAEAIGAAFAAWLLDRKESDFTTKLRISLGHDSRISAKSMQVRIISIYGEKRFSRLMEVRPL